MYFLIIFNVFLSNDFEHMTNYVICSRNEKYRSCGVE